VKRFSLLKKKISTVSTACDSGSGLWYRSIASSSSSSSSCSGDDPPIAAGTADQFECRQAQEKRYLFFALCFVQIKPSLCFCAFKHRIGSAQGGKKKKSSQHHDDEERFV
jgi:hypothetical protein